MTILPITLTMAAAAALLNIWLALRAGRTRTAEKVSIGDGGNLRLIARMRAHANFVEYTPFVLILIAAIELARGSSDWLWAAGSVYMLARAAHAFGMDSEKPGLLRVIGTAVTLLTLLGLSLYALYVPFMGYQPIVTNIAASG